MYTRQPSDSQLAGCGVLGFAAIWLGGALFSIGTTVFLLWLAYKLVMYVTTTVPPPPPPAQVAAPIEKLWVRMSGYRKVEGELRDIYYEFPDGVVSRSLVWMQYTAKDGLEHVRLPSFITKGANGELRTSEQRKAAWEKGDPNVFKVKYEDWMLKKVFPEAVIEFAD